MGEKKKAKEIMRKISKQKKRVANSLGKTIEKKSHLFSMLIPIMAGVIFLLLSSLNLRSSVWFDESYSAYLVRGNFSEIYDLTAQDVHPPMYYFALKMWTSIFGTTDVSMRFLSVFFGLLAIVFIFQLLKKMFGIKAASLGTIFVSISPMFIRYAQEIRMYTMVFLIVILATYCLILALENGKNKAAIKYWVLYGLLLSLGMWTHYFVVFAWLSHVYIIVKHFGGIKKIIKNKIIVKRLVLVYGLAVLLYIPWLPVFVRQVLFVENSFWIPPVSFESISDLVSSILFFNKGADVYSWGWAFGTALISVFILIFKDVAKKNKKKNKISLSRIIAIIVIPIILMTVLSLPPLMSMFVERYVLYSIVLIWALFGVLTVLTKNDILKCLMTVLAIIVSIYGIVFVTNRETEGHISEILSETFIAAETKEPIIMATYQDYYDGVFYTNDNHPIYMFGENINYEHGSQEPIRRYRVNLIDNKDDFLKDYDSVWYIMPKPGPGEDYDIPDWASEMRITSEISLDYHSALEFTK